MITSSSISSRNVKSDLSFVMFLHNAEKIRYPWRQGIKSVLPVADKVIVVLAGPNEDNTVDEVSRFISSPESEYRVMVVYGESCTPIDTTNLGRCAVYDKRAEWPTSHIGLSALVNIGVEYANTKWVAQIQGDELFDEVDYEELLGLSKLPDNVDAASFSFRHFCGDFFHTFPFIYQRVTRAFRTDSDFLFVGDAVQAQGHGEVYQANVTVNHVGKVSVGREAQAAFKEFTFQDLLYAHGKCWEGDVDPLVKAAYEEGKLDFFKVFDSTVKRGDVKDYSGPWPKYVREWAHELGVELL